MKPILLILFTLFLSLASVAQIPLDSFYKDGTRWVDICYYQRSLTSSSPVNGSEAYEYVINGDTTMNNNTYKKIYSRMIGSSTLKNLPGSLMYIGRIRTENNTKVYFADDRNALNSPYRKGIDTLIYDFSDTAWGGIPYDTITINSGHKIKRFNYYDPNQFYLEGIGFKDGFWHTHLLDLWWLNYRNSMLCYQSGDMLYKSGAKDPLNNLNWYLLENCYDINLLNTQTINLPSDISVSPNPSNGIFSITGTTVAEQTLVTVYNSKGQKVLDKTIIGNNISTEIQLNNSTPGIYTISIRSSDMVKHEKLIVQ